MSDVRLSNASPTLERTDPRVAEHPKPSACRNLFGTSVDHEELHRDLKVHLRELEADASDKWSFDFANDAPILANTRITWELVDCRTVPDFYTRQPHRHHRHSHSREKGEACTAGNNHVDMNGNHSCVVGSTAEDKDCAGARKRHACHEHSAQSKRSHGGSESHSAERTPRKSSPTRQT
ncbi:unnamed protein product [Knipowitschia caucasica]